MAISFRCPSCGKNYQQPDSAAGRMAKCGCGTQFTVPQPGGGDDIPQLTDADLAPADDVPQLTDADLAPAGDIPQLTDADLAKGQSQPMGDVPQLTDADLAPMTVMPTGQTGSKKWLLPTAIGGGVVGVIGIVVLVVVLMSGEDEGEGEPVAVNTPPAKGAPTNSGGNTGAANSGRANAGQNNNSGQPSGNGQAAEDAFIASLPSANWANTSIDSFPSLDESTARSLGWASYNEEDDAERMVEALFDENPRKRLAGLSTLSSLLADEPLTKFRERIAAGVTENLNHDIPEIRVAAAEVCYRLGEDAAPALIPLAVLLRDGTSVDEHMTAGEAMAALGEAARPAIPLLYEVAMANTMNNRIGYHRCVQGCVVALANLNCREMVFELHNTPGYTQRYSLEAMGKLDPVPPEAMQIMFDAAGKGSTSYWSGHAFVGLSHVRPTSDRIMQAFRDGFDSADDVTRMDIMEALANLEADTSGLRELVEKGLADENGGVQISAEDTARKFQFADNDELAPSEHE